MTRTKIVEEASNASPSAADELASTLGPEPKPRSGPRPVPAPNERRVIVPVDMINEQVLIASAFDPNCREHLRALSPDHFFGDAEGKNHSEIWRCLKLVDEQGLQYSPALLKSFSSSLDVAYLELLAKAHRVPDAATLRYHVERLVWDKARVEGSRGPLAELLKALQDPTTAAEAVLTKVDELRAAFAQGQSAKTSGLIDADAIFAPLPPIAWVVEALDLCPGAPAMVAGYGYGGKTAALQSLAIAVAMGHDVWGKFASTAGRVIHFDYEQGNRLTRERYQRFAGFAGVDAAALQGRLSLVVHPPCKLNAPGAEAYFTARCAGYQLAIIDSFKAACPGTDENSSEARAPLDMLAKVSEATGCMFIVLHHARKPSTDAPGGTKMAIRGSGAIFDGCSSVLVFQAEKGKPTVVSHEKARTSGRLYPDFELLIDDFSVDGDPRGGLRVLASDLDDPQRLARVQAEQEHKRAAKNRAEDERLRAEVKRRLTAAQEPRSRNDVAKEVSARRTTVLAVITDLVRDGELLENDAGKVCLRTGTTS